MCAADLPFDPVKAGGPRRGPDVGEDVTTDIVGSTRPPRAPGNSPGKDQGAGASPLTVSMLVGRIKGALLNAFADRVHVVGEISNLKAHSSGHMYFRLKDAGAAIDAVMFRASAGRLKFRPTDGLEVVAEGRVDVYESRGQVQLYVERMTPKGAGALELAFQQLRQKLQREGLFDPAHKIPLPRFPRAIGVVTSPTGAAIRDIRKILRRRWPAAKVYLAPALVQGDGAAESIAAAIDLLDASAQRLGIDTIIIGRGGGSLEDLWAFNEEVVALAVFRCVTPIISGVGHEVDVTISDLVADLRASTPSGAAELAVPDAAEVRRQVAELGGRLARAVGEDIANASLALESVLRSAVFRDPMSAIRSYMQRMDELSHRLRGGLREELSRSRRRLEDPGNRLAALHPARLHERSRARVAELVDRMRWALGGQSKRAGDILAAMEGRLSAAHPRHRLLTAAQKVEMIERQLRSMSYHSVLSRGFSITRSADGRILRWADEVADGQMILTELERGMLHSVVTDKQGQTAVRRLDTPAAGAMPAPIAPAQRRRSTPRKRPHDDDPGLFD